jgi:hypothetical protein
MKLYKGTVRKSAGGGGFRHHQSRRMSNCTQRRAIRQSGGCSHRTAVYVVELSLKLSPMPVSVQRKELADAQALYSQIMAVLESGHPRVLELSCEKAEEKRVSLLSSELVAVQLYERSAAGGTGTKRPGFSVDS